MEIREFLKSPEYSEWNIMERDTFSRGPSKLIGLEEEKWGVLEIILFPSRKAVNTIFRILHYIIN